MGYWVDPADAYADNWEHLEDELRRLDLLIHHQVLKHKQQYSDNPLEQWKGLVLSDEEIAGLLAEPAAYFVDITDLNCHDARITSIHNELKKLEFRIQQKRAASLKEGITLSLTQLASLFNLTPFEEQCLLICLAPALHRKYEKFYAYLQDDVTCKNPSVDLLLQLACRTTKEKILARPAFEATAPLLKYRLLQVDSIQDSMTPLLSRSLKLDDRIINFLLGFEQVDTRLASVLREASPRPELVPISLAEQVQYRLKRFVQVYLHDKGAQCQSLLFYFQGPYGTGKENLAGSVCRAVKMPLIIADVEKMTGGRVPLEEMTWLLGREAILRQAALCLDNFEFLLDDFEQYRFQINHIIETTRSCSPLTFLLGDRPWKPQGMDQGVFFDIEFPVPGDKARLELWQALGRNYRLNSDIDLGALAGKFCFTPGQICDALSMAQNLASWRSPEDAQVNLEDLHSACRAQTNHKLGSLTQRIKPVYGWEDIVLPPDQINQLKELCSHVKYRYLVYGEWGFGQKHSYGKGSNALFCGPPGTGKTMAAQIIAKDLNLDLYRVDLSQVISKYIGETEKNLKKIFQEAQASSAILFFEEADALFGKRSEVKDAHDRYANIEVSYLLQKMEEYEGVAILATNLRSNMDEAFVRRIQFTVEFPFPDAVHRNKIWQAVFAKDAPRCDDVDFAFLADRFEFSGGNIKNIVLRAAFFAAESSGVIDMEHIIRATKREMQMIGKLFIEEDFAAYRHNELCPNERKSGICR